MVSAALHAPALVTASVASSSLFFTRFRQVFQSNERWVKTGTAWLTLEREIVRYHLLPEAARDDAARQALLDRTAAIVLTETQEWADLHAGSPSLPPTQADAGAPPSP